VRLASQLLRGRSTLKSKRLVSLRDSEGFVLRASSPMAFQLDGDYLGQRSKVEFVSVPNALRVAC
jgi:diacylglycerol kinase family enzyme